MVEVKWIKLSIDMFDNKKIRYLRRLPDGNNIVLIWIMLLCFAGRSNAGGYIMLTEDIPYTVSMLADELDVKENTVRLALTQLSMLKMVHTVDEVLVISNWDKYQNLSDMREYNRLAKQRSRRRSSLEAALEGQTDVNDMSMTSQTNVNDMSMTSQGDVIECQAIEERRKKEEEEEESKREEEEEKEEVIQSFNLSREEVKQSYIGGKIGKGVVMLSDVQLEDLLNKLSLEEFDKYVEIVANNELRGHHYRKRTHYMAILDMVNKDRRISR